MPVAPDESEGKGQQEDCSMTEVLVNDKLYGSEYWIDQSARSRFDNKLHLTAQIEFDQALMLNHDILLSQV